jgi:hypothetical protein
MRYLEVYPATIKLNKLEDSCPDTPALPTRFRSSTKQPESLELGEVATSGAMLSADRTFVMIGTRKIAIHAKVFKSIPVFSSGTTDATDLTALFGKYAYDPETVDYIVHILHLRYVFDETANPYDYLTYNERLFQMLRQECASDMPLPMRYMLGGDDPWFKETVCKYHKDLDFHHWMFENRGEQKKALNERIVLHSTKAFWSAGILYIIGHDRARGVGLGRENPLLVDEYEAPLMMTVADPGHPDSIWEERILNDLRPYKNAENLRRHESDNYTDDWREAAVGAPPGVRVIARPPRESERWHPESSIYLYTHVPVRQIRTNALYVVDDTFRVREAASAHSLRAGAQHEATPFNSFVTSSTMLVSHNTVTQQQFITYDAFPNWYEIRDLKTRTRLLFEHRAIEPLFHPYDQPIDLRNLLE